MRRTKTIAVAMSGGVDSTFAAALLLEHGFEVIGLTAEMLGDIQSDPPTEERIRRAVEAARRLGIRHHILDVRPIFHKKVVEPFVHAYLTGHTPNPCVLCNREIKFGILLDEALKHGAEYFATGHYARLRRGSDGKMCLLRARDRSRDQSYFLARLTASELERCIFPLGERAKRDVVREVVERGLA
ncbi:MAG: tRNA-specific 2-thiouridylase, partial [Kiritimatiellae bacterium]|nr:tRNA-specific 2-thiouridylase [Kiritimatiellia bacterium]